MDNRIEFIRQWYSRGENSKDEFDRFIFLWLCMVCIAKYWYSQSRKLDRNYDEPLEDGTFIKKFYENDQNSKLIMDAIEDLPEFDQLAKRKSPSEEYIISYPGKEEGLFKDLYMHKCFGTVMTIKNQSKAIGIALRAIRNNLFHGGKLYESSADKNLLKLATPILKIILLKAANEIMHIDLNRSIKDESDKV